VSRPLRRWRKHKFDGNIWLNEKATKKKTNSKNFNNGVEAIIKKEEFQEKPS